MLAVLIMLIMMAVGARADLEVAVRLAHESYMLGQPIEGIAQITNTGSEQIVIWHGLYECEGGTRHIIRTAAERIHVEYRDQPLGTKLPGAPAILEPGESILKPIFLVTNDQGPMLRDVGEYDYVLEMTLALRGDAVHERIVIESEAVKIDVGEPGCGYGQYMRWLTRAGVRSGAFLHSFNEWSDFEAIVGEMDVYCDYTASVNAYLRNNYLSYDLSRLVVSGNGAPPAYESLRQKVLVGIDQVQQGKFGSNDVSDRLWRAIRAMITDKQQGSHTAVRGGDVLISYF